MLAVSCRVWSWALEVRISSEKLAMGGKRRPGTRVRPVSEAQTRLERRWSWCAKSGERLSCLRLSRTRSSWFLGGSLVFENVEVCS